MTPSDRRQNDEVILVMVRGIQKDLEEIKGNVNKLFEKVEDLRVNEAAGSVKWGVVTFLGITAVSVIVNWLMFSVRRV